MGQIPDASNEAIIRALLAELALSRARITDLTVELECARQYVPRMTGAVKVEGLSPTQNRTVVSMPWASTVG